ncbi:MAG: ABC transporter permease [Anaerolineaceae bacterium]|nr:ABC transporter permease [Anaerolineaceae bacterium]
MSVAAWEDRQMEPDPRPRLTRPKLLLIISGAGIITLLLSSIFASYLAPYDPIVISPAELQPPTAEHPFGTDQVGRDILSRVIYGSRLSLLISAGVISLTLMIGLPVGTLAAMTGGWVDEILMRLTDVFFSFPYLILAMAIIATLGVGATSLVLALGVVWWPSYARMVRGMVLSIKERPFVEAAYVVGNSKLGVVVRHILPHTAEELSVRISLDVGNVILIATGLSFLGLGAQPPVPEWGSMLGEARPYILSGWWLSFFPGIVIVLAVLCFSLFGDALQDVLRPEQNR